MQNEKQMSDKVVTVSYAINSIRPFRPVTRMFLKTTLYTNIKVLFKQFFIQDQHYVHVAFLETTHRHTGCNDTLAPPSTAQTKSRTI